MTPAAERLRDAARTGIPCDPVRDLIGPADIPAAYAVQQELTAARLAEGRRVVGRKIGLTSPAVQRQLGVDQPDFGTLFDDMACAQDVPIDAGRLLQPRIEAEIAFVLVADVTDPDRLTDAIGHAVAALEIVDSRIAGWDITIADTVADNASSGLYVLGDRQVPLSGLDTTTMTMTLDGVQVSTGDAPVKAALESTAWLARTALGFTDPLRAGDVVLSGALGPMVPVRPGTRFRAEIGGLGTVRARFA